MAPGRFALTATVAAWRDYLPRHFPLPHPSWRNTGWLNRNPWFAAEALPELRRRVAILLSGGSVDEGR
jgi:uracil-DNA glycosylase